MANNKVMQSVSNSDELSLSPSFLTYFPNLKISP
nr:MAG TPA_asm: hypothetical protein [Caudoviricetes sp.]